MNISVNILSLLKYSKYIAHIKYDIFYLIVHSMFLLFLGVSTTPVFIYYDIKNEQNLPVFLYYIILTISSLDNIQIQLFQSGLPALQTYSSNTLNPTNCCGYPHHKIGILRYLIRSQNPHKT